MISRPDIPLGTTYNEHGLERTYKDRSGYWEEYAHDHNGRVSAYTDSTGYASTYTYTEEGKELAYKNSSGFWYEYFYDLGVIVKDFKVYEI